MRRVFTTALWYTCAVLDYVRFPHYFKDEGWALDWQLGCQLNISYLAARLEEKWGLDK